MTNRSPQYSVYHFLFTLLNIFNEAYPKCEEGKGGDYLN